MQDGKQRRTQAERRAETKRALLDAARKLFVEKGFADTGTPEIVSAANVTRGALYHHFADKTDLLRAVLHEEAAAVAREIDQDTDPAQSPADAFSSGAAAYFKAMQVPGRARLLLLEGPAVLGFGEMTELDRKTGGATLLEGLRHSADHGALEGVPLAPLADLLSAAFDRAALAISRGEKEAEYRRAIEALFIGLLRPPGT